jgi:antitoxin component of MazEF toxin-antitoxin module
MATTAKKAGKIKFRTTILQAGKTATGIRIPEEIVESLGAGKRPPVKVTINSYTYRSTIAVMGGTFMVGISAVVRENAGVKGGDEIDVHLELDTQPREVVLPADFKKALDRDKLARQKFDGLSYSNKQRHVLPVEQAKTEETRQRRIEKAISLLRKG